ncbi:MAG TPA: PLxRFG domain-containing protein [Pseudoxanthomonas sp.]
MDDNLPAGLSYKNPLEKSDLPEGLSYSSPSSQAVRPQIEQPTGFVGSVVQGFKRALPETKSLLAGATAAAAGAVGADRVRDAALGYYRDVQKNEVEPLANQASFIGGLKGESSLGEWAGDTLGNFAGQALQSVAAAGAGAAIGSVVPGAGTAGGAVTGLVARPLVRKLVGKEVAKLATEGAAKKAVGRSLLTRAGMVAAPTALNIGQETGIAYTGRADDAAAAGEQLDQGDALRAIAAGVPAGLIDTAGEALIAGRFLHGAGQSPSLVRRVLVGGVKGAATEGATEGAQAVLERAGAGQRLTGADAYTDYVENIAAGALGGGVPGGASGIRRQRVLVDPVSGQTSAVPNPANGPISRAANTAAASGAVPTIDMPAAAADATPGLTAEAGNANRRPKRPDMFDRRLEEQLRAAAAQNAVPQVDTGAGEILAPTGDDGKPGRTSRWLDEQGFARKPSHEEAKAYLREKLIQTGALENRRADGKAINEAIKADGEKLEAAIRNPALRDAWRELSAEAEQAQAAPDDQQNATEPSGSPGQFGPNALEEGLAPLQAELARPQPAETSQLGGTDARIDGGGALDGQANAVEGRRLADAMPAGAGDARADASVPADGAQAQEVRGAQPPAIARESEPATPAQPDSALQPQPDLGQTPAAQAPSPVRTESVGGTAQPEGAGAGTRLAGESEGQSPESAPAPADSQASAIGEQTMPASGTASAASTTAAPQPASAAQAVVPGATASPVAAAAAEAATSPKNDRPEPTDAQKEAGNYKKGHVKVGGLDISIENEAGTSRRPEWPPLKHHYGYLKGTIGKDKDHVDVFLTENAEDTSRPVFVVDQYDKGKFDEHKVVLGAASEQEAREAYLANYSPDFQQASADGTVKRGAGAITQMSQDEFKAWVRDQKATTRPAGAPPQSARAAAAQAVNAIVARVADGEPAEKALKGVDDATARAVAVQLGRRFSKTAKATAIAGNLGRQSQADIQKAARRSVEVASMGAPAPEPAETEGKPKKAAKKAAATPGNTEDAGAELSANRRGKSANGLAWADIEGLNPTMRVREVQKSKIWPRPDLEQLIDDGMPPVAAHVIKQVYDSLAAAPQSRDSSDGDLLAYVETVQAIRDALFTWAKGLPPEDGASVTDHSAPNLLQTVFPNQGSGTNPFTGPPNKDNNHRALLIGGNKPVRALQGGRKMQSAAFKWAVQRMAGEKPAAWARQYQIEQRGDGSWVAYRKKDRRAVEDGQTGRYSFETRAEAERRAADDYERRQLEKAQAKKSEKTGQPSKESQRVEAAERTGPAFRQEGEDITSDRLMETFGLRGVNFGNWLKGNSPKLLRERQLHLNHAFDALMDLADLTGLPPKALSLNGMLGLAIGAQGNGGGAAAHFVPGVNEINITREHGAGSLAHEWAHALDHYFAVQAGERIARDRLPFLTQWSSDERQTAGVRPEIRQAFNKIVNNMESRPLTAAEQASRDQKRREGLEKRIRTALANLRADAPSLDDEAVNEWQALTERLLAGDIGEGVVDSGFTSKALTGRQRVAVEVNPAAMEILKLVREHGGEKARYLLQNIVELDMYSRHLSLTLKEQAQPGQHEPQDGKPVTQTTASDYLREAKLLDATTGKKQGGKAYWSSKLEMFARAFQSYVLDRLAAKGQRSDYLTYQQMSEEAHKALNSMLSDLGQPAQGDRFPRQAERARINDAFDLLLGEIQTRESDGGKVALFSRRGWDESFPDAVLGHKVGVVQAHPDYAAAKRGNTPAALRLAQDVVTSDYVQAIKDALPKGAKPVVVPVLAMEAAGNNRIPQAAAHVLANKLGLKVDDGIVQASKVSRGGADGASRLGRQPKFAGAVAPGQEYLLLDDTLTQGGTLAQLKTHIEDAGGKVLLVSALTGKDYSRKIALSPATLGRLRDRFGSIENWWRDTFGYGFEGFTESEAGYLLKLRGDPTPESIRDRVAAGGLPEVRGVLRSQAGAQGVTRGLAFDQAQALKQQLTANWGRNAPRVVLVANSSDLAAAARGAGVNLSAADVDRVEGLYLGKPTVWINLSEIPTAERFQQVLTHEALGHFGVERVIGRDEWRSITEAIGRHVENGTGAQDVRDAIAQLRRTQPGIFSDPETVAKEVIAVMAEKGSRNGLVQRVVAAVRRFLRRIMPGQRWSDAEIRALLHQADRFLRAGQSNQQARAATRALAFSQKADTFYSAIAQSVDTGKGAPKRGTAEQWKGWMDGAQRRGEFKQAERDWLGVDAWLDGQGTVTRDQLAEFIRANEVQVQEVVLGEKKPMRPSELRERASELYEQYGGDNIDDAMFVIDEWIAGDMPTNDAARELGIPASALSGLKKSGDTGTKFASYQLPGGKNYRELLLTLPMTADSARLAKLHADVLDANDVGDFQRRDAAYDEIEMLESKGVSAYRSNHFDQPNILAHVRFNERTGADGKRVLFLEEVQSDWHQAGRKQGYGSAKVLTSLPEGVTFTVNGNIISVSDANRMLGVRSLDGADPADKALEVVNFVRQEGRDAGVPDAPFKGTDEWAMLAFKRMVRYAAEQGFDRIAWTTGDQQAARYDLSKQVSRVTVGSIGNSYQLSAFAYKSNDEFGLGGEKVLNRQITSLSDLDELIGKDAADKARAQVAARGAADLRGEDLKVGGEGMGAFYDKILPSAVNKWAKKLGGRVGEARIPLDKFSVTRQDMSSRVDFDTAEQANAYAAKHNGTVYPATLYQVHALDLTDAMREAAMAGQPLFSRAPADSIDALQTAIREINGEVEGGEKLLDRVKQWVKDATPEKLKNQFRSAWLGALTTRHLTQLGSDYFPTMGVYSDYLAEMGADRNQLQQESEEVAEGVRKWAGKNRGEATTLFELMHDATILGVDPAEAYKPLQYRMSGKMHDVTPKNIKEALKVLREVMRGRAGDDKRGMIEEANGLRAMLKAEPKRKATYPRLAARWNQLSPEAQAHYRAMRDLYAKRHDQTEAALIQRINDLKMEGGEKRKAVLINMIRQQFEAQRLQGVYFPLQRFGKYFVAAERGDGSTFQMYESQADLQRAVKGLRARGFKITAQGLKADGKAKDAPSGTFVAEVIEKLRSSGVSERTQDEIYQMYLHALPDLSMRKHKIHRKSVPGWDPDALRAFAFNMAHGAHQLARLRYAHKLSDTIEVLQGQQDAKRKDGEADTARIVAGDAILEELRKRHEWISNPQDSKLTNLVSSAGFVYYLGLTPAAALVNITQTPLISYPYLASRFGGAKAMNAMLAAGRDAIRTVGNIQRTLTDPDEVRAHQVLQQMGALDKTQAHNLMGIAEGGLAGHNPAWAKAMEIIGWGFHKTEVVNREATGLAAFRLARGAGQSFDQAVKTAAETINETHYDYTNANRARFMQSGTAKVLLMFRQYSLNTTWHLGRMVWNATKGADPEVKRIARRNLAGILGMSALFSGALGLPMAGVVMGVLNSVAASAGDDDEPWDAETELRKFLVAMLGEGPARVLLGGVANEVTGADIAGRVSLSQLWFRDADRELDGRGMYYNLLEQAAGPMGGVLKNALVGKQLMDEGHVMRGVETVLPKSLKDAVKSARYATEGVNNLRGDAIVPDIGLRQLLLQLGGFTPAEVAERYDTNRALKNYEQHVLDRRSRLVDAFALATRTGDAGGRADAMQQIRKFNTKWPEIRITPRTLKQSMRARARYSAQAESGIVLNKKIAGRVREAVGAE